MTLLRSSLNPRVGRYGYPQLSRSQVEQRGQDITMSQLEFAKQKYNEVLGTIKNAFGKYGQNIWATLPPELQQIAGLFQPGGQFGAGTERAIQKGMGQEISSGNIASAMTGMGSSTTSMARTSGAIRNARDAHMLAEEERLKLLGGALGQVGTGRLQAQQINAQTLSDYLRTIANV